MMADNTSVLKEFLVAIGFKVDDKGLAKVEAGVKKTGEAAEKFSLGLIAAVTAVTLFVDKVSSKMEGLYWSSVRLRDGAAAIQDFSLRLSKIGGTAEGAKASLEGLASALRTDPAAEGVLHNLGIATRDAKGNLRGALEMVQELAKAPMPYWLKAKWAGYFGIDENTLLALQQDGIKTQKVYADLYKKLGISEDEATRQSAEYQNSLRDLRATFDVLGVAVAQRVMPAIKDFVGWLQDVATNHDVVNRLSTIATDIIAIGTGAAKLFAALPNEALEWGAIGYFLFGKKAAIILASLGVVSSLLDKMAGDKSEVNEKKVEEYGTKGGIGGYGANRWAYEHGLGYLNTNEFNATYAEYKRRHSAAGASLPATQDAFTPEAGSISGASGDRAAKVMAFFQKAGWSAQQAAGIVANLVSESRLNPNAVGDNGQAYGVAQWHPDRQAAFKAWAGKDIRNSTIEEQLAFVQHEMETGVNAFTKQMLLAAQSAAQAAVIVSRYYESPYDPMGNKAMSRAYLATDLMNGISLAPARTAGGGITVNQKTDIHVDGSSDAQSTGRAVAREQDRVNGDIARNFAGAVN